MIFIHHWKFVIIYNNFVSLHNIGVLITLYTCTYMPYKAQTFSDSGKLTLTVQLVRTFVELLSKQIQEDYSNSLVGQNFCTEQYIIPFSHFNVTYRCLYCTYERYSFLCLFDFQFFLFYNNMLQIFTNLRLDLIQITSTVIFSPRPFIVTLHIIQIFKEDF